MSRIHKCWIHRQRNNNQTKTLLIKLTTFSSAKPRALTLTHYTIHISKTMTIIEIFTTGQQDCSRSSQLTLNTVYYSTVSQVQSTHVLVPLECCRQFPSPGYVYVPLLSSGWNNMYPKPNFIELSVSLGYEKKGVQFLTQLFLAGIRFMFFLLSLGWNNTPSTQILLNCLSLGRGSD